MPVSVGEAFAGFTILRVLGAGGMGTVYLAAHPRLPRQDALKVLPTQWTADPQYRARFLREADLTSSLSHPNILGVHDRGEYDGQLWISMDYVGGTDASRLVREHHPDGLPVGEALEIITAVASALDYAHQRGLLHRDVKPANILLDPQAQRIFLADFGIARLIDDPSGLTATNMAVGTMAYAAPEQLRGEPLDGRTDQYALACTAFDLLTGAPPYVDSNPAVVITKHVAAPVPSLGERRPELAALDPVLARAMAKAPADRYPSCRDFARELSYASQPAVRPRPPVATRAAAGPACARTHPDDQHCACFTPDIDCVAGGYRGAAGGRGRFCGRDVCPAPRSGRHHTIDRDRSHRACVQRHLPGGLRPRHRPRRQSRSRVRRP